MPGNDTIHPIYDRWGRLQNFDFCSAVEPTKTEPYMTWIDPNVQALKVRDQQDAGWITIAAGGGAPTGAQYLVLEAHPTLTDERRFVAGDGFQAADGGAGGDYTVGVDSTVVRTSGTQSIAGLKTFTTQVNLGSGATLALLNGLFSCTRQQEPPGQFIFSGAETNTIKQALLLRHQSADNAAAGFGVRTVYRLDNEYSIAQDAAYLDVVWSDPSSGSEDAYFSFKVMAAGASPAEVCRVGGDEIIFSDANVGIGASPGAGYHLRVEDTAIDTASGYTGIASIHTKTAGASDHSDNFYGMMSAPTLNQSGGEIGHLIGVYGVATVSDGSVGDAVNTRGLYGGYFYARALGGTVTGHSIGFYCPAVIDGGTINSGYGFYTHVWGVSGTINGNLFGGLIIVDDDIGAGTVYDLYLLEYTGVDYGIYQYGTGANHLGGSLYVAGAFTNAGGSDPPYELFWEETRDSVIERIKRGVPPSRLGGLAVFYNRDTGKLELFRPSTGEFFEMQAILAETRAPVTETVEPLVSYHFDQWTGQVEQVEHPDQRGNFRIRKGYELAPETGQFWKIRMELDSNGVPMRVRERIASHVEAVEERNQKT